MTMRMNKSKFEDLFGDPLYWKEKANRHSYSAGIIHGHLQELLKTDDNWTQEDDQHFISLMDAFFLLVALSFENVLKGLIISRELNIVDKTEYETKYGFNYKHDLKKMFSTNFRKLTNIENELVDRLQNYLNWMSKYPVPLEKHLTKEVSHSYNIHDFEVSNIMFAEIVKTIENNVNKDIFTYLTNRNQELEY